MRPLLKSLCVLTLALLGACNPIRSPQIEHLGVREVELTPERAVYSFRFRATNPNDEALPLGEIRYELLMGGERVFEGLRSPEATLDTFGSREFEIPAVIDRSVINLSGVVDYTLSGYVTYIPPGRFRQELYRSRMRVPKSVFSIDGSVDVD